MHKSKAGHGEGAIKRYRVLFSTPPPAARSSTSTYMPAEDAPPPEPRSGGSSGELELEAA